MTWTSHLICQRFGLCTFKMGIIIQLRFKDSFKPKGEAIRFVFPRNAGNAWARSEARCMNQTFSLAHLLLLHWKHELCFSLFCASADAHTHSAWNSPTFISRGDHPLFCVFMIFPQLITPYCNYVCHWHSQGGGLFLGVARLSYSSLYPLPLSYFLILGMHWLKKWMHNNI